jgi:hypothetical protein
MSRISALQIAKSTATRKRRNIFFSFGQKMEREDRCYLEWNKLESGGAAVAQR